VLRLRKSWALPVHLLYTFQTWCPHTGTLLLALPFKITKSALGMKRWTAFKCLSLGLNGRLWWTRDCNPGCSKSRKFLGLPSNF
jgi:hypothetical protein